jgi:D-alanyl-D-alanine carboxypeptidase
VESVQDQLEALVATGVPGAVVVAVGPDARIEAAAGLANVQTGEALTPGHRFRIGSVTKIFVGTLVLRLVDDGLLDLDGDAAPFAEGITIRQLLNHTSGLDDSDTDLVAFFEPYRRDPRTDTSSGTGSSSYWSSRNRACSRRARGGRITAATTSCWG